MKKAICTAVIVAVLSSVTPAFSQDAPMPPRPGNGGPPPGHTPRQQEPHRQPMQPPPGQHGDNGPRHDKGPPRHIDRAAEQRAREHRDYQRGIDRGARFHDRERESYRDWYSRYPRYYRPAPPRVMDQLRVQGYLPRGHYAPAARVVVQDLPRLPSGYGYYTVGTQIVIAAVATGLIIDLLSSR